jgi:hypothetical protein
LAIPYGIHDVAANTGWVSVGADHDTSAFAVETLRRWWHTVGAHRYPDADRLLICADGGGSQRLPGPRLEDRTRRVRRRDRPDDHRLPPAARAPASGTRSNTGCSPRSPLNWRGRPLTSHQIIVDLIGATSTTTGLTVRAELDTGTYPTGIRYTKKQVDALPITRHDFHGEWNYTVSPAPADTPTST